MKDSPLLRQLGAIVSQQISPEDVPTETWPEIIGAALYHGLAPMLLWVTKQHTPGIVTEPLWTPIITVARMTAIRYVTLENSRKQVTAALEAAQIPALWLKGIALAHTIYPQPALRAMGDLDILIPYAQRENALHIIENSGYHFYETDSQLITSHEALKLNLTHHYNLKGGIDNSVLLELHFRLLSTDNELLPLDKLEWFWTQTTTIQNGSQFTIPQPEAHLLYLCAHAILQHGEDETLLRQYFDLHQLITSAPLDWDKVIAQSAVLGWGYAIERALSIAIQYFSTPIPAPVFAELQQGRPEHDAAADRAVQLVGRGSRGEQAWMSFRQLSFTKRIGLARRLLFPSPSYMRSRYHLRPDQRVLTAYPYRWFEQGRAILWAMGSRLSRTLRQ